MTNPTSTDNLICDLLRNCRDLDEVENMIVSMPEQHQKRARVMLEMMTADALDAYMDVGPVLREWLHSL